MAKITRATLKQFGSTGTTGYFGKFGSQAAGAPVTTKDVATIQSLTAWLNGFQDALTLNTKAPYLEDMNSLFYVMAYMQAYSLQEGIAEYDAGTTYFIGSIVKKTGTTELYSSIVDTNTANALPIKVNDTKWKYLGDLQNLENYDPAITRKYMIPAAAFRPYAAGGASIVDGLQVKNEAVGSLTHIAPIQLPVGAIITGVKMYYYCNGSSIGLALYRTDMAGNIITVAGLSNGSTSGYSSDTTASISSGTIIEGYAYTMNVNLDPVSVNTNAMLCGVEISYTITKPLP